MVIVLQPSLRLPGFDELPAEIAVRYGDMDVVRCVAAGILAGARQTANAATVQ
jgi:hypothetical protein